MKFPTMEEFAKSVAEKALDEYEYNGKTLREWIEIIASNDGDTISRKAAIEAVEFGITYAKAINRETGEVTELFNESNNELRGAVDRIKQLPPIQPKSGRWILDRSGAYCCSECMEPCAGYVMMKPRDKFCKMCGSRNEVTT